MALPCKIEIVGCKTIEFVKAINFNRMIKLKWKWTAMDQKEMDRDDLKTHFVSSNERNR